MSVCVCVCVCVCAVVGFVNQNLFLRPTQIRDVRKISMLFIMLQMLMPMQTVFN
jgi:hypothetical protein